MDPATTAILVTALGQGLIKAFGMIVEKGVVDPALESGLEQLRKFVQRGYKERRDRRVLRKAVLAALDDVKARHPEFDSFDRLIITKKVTGLSLDVQTILAAAALEMATSKPEIIPEKLISELGMAESDKQLLADFLYAFRKQLADEDKYRDSINYVNELAKLGYLDGLTVRVGKIEVLSKRGVKIAEESLEDKGRTIDKDKAYTEYIDHLISKLKFLPIPLLQSTPTTRTDFELSRVFVPLYVYDRMAIFEERFEGKVLVESNRTFGLGETLARYQKFIMLGPPGSGKTTLLRRAALAFAEHQENQDLGWQGEHLFPIFVRLRNFGAFLANNKDDYSAPSHGALVSYLDHYFRKENRLLLPARFFDNQLEAGKCLVLLDGLDEATLNREEVAQQVCAFIRHYERHGNRFGITSRPKGYESVQEYFQPLSLAVLDVLPLLPDGIQDLIANILFLIVEDPLQQDKDGENLSREILESAALTKIASVPMLCTALVMVYKYRGAKLPHRRVEVLQEIISLMLGFWKQREDQLYKVGELARDDGTGEIFKDLHAAVSSKRSRLSHLAHEMQIARSTELNKNEAIRILSNYLESWEGKDTAAAREWAENFLQNSHERSGVFVEMESGTYAFAHEGFREYLAATYLINESEDIVQEILERVPDEDWEQVVLFAGAHPGLMDSLRRKLINEMLQEGKRGKHSSSIRLRYLLTAGRVTRDMTHYLPEPNRDDVKESLHALMTFPGLAPVIRAEAGDVLGELGWLPDDLYEFVHVPAGEGVNEFWMGVYPVTNVQYARFLREENFADPDLWSGFAKYDKSSQLMKDNWGNAGWDWLQGELDGLSPDEKRIIYPRYWNDMRFGIARKGVPVVEISWYEANAYCRWLERNWKTAEEGKYLGNPHGGQVRLPLEMEWEKAAGGVKPDGRYSWDRQGEETGDVKEIIRRANIRESEIGRTTPVGMYPLGADPQYGFHDLAGNTWEWLANFYDDDQDSLVLRGGSFIGPQNYARCADRNGVNPLNWLYYLGFRVVLSP